MGEISEGSERFEPPGSFGYAHGWCRPRGSRSVADHGALGRATDDVVPMGWQPAGMGHVLVAYASKRGSTAEIAEAVADALRRSGYVVECRAVEQVRSIDSYDAVVLGSAVYMKRWRGDAKRFLRKHGEELSHLPFWVFSSGPVGDPDKMPDRSWLEPPRIIADVEELGVRGHVVFGGRMPTEPHGPLERSMVKNTAEQYRDRRDWEEVRAWARRIASELHALAPAA